MYNYPAGCVQRPGWVLFTSRGQAGEPYAGGCRGNCSDRPARVSLCALCARLSCSLPSISGNSARIHCRRQCIRALCKAVTWVADLSPLQAACAALRLSPCGAAVSLLPCWSCEAWSHAAGVFDWARSGQSGAWGSAPTSERRNPKGYRRALLADFIKIP